MISKSCLLKCMTVLLFSGFFAFADPCPICSHDGHDAANCPNRPSPFRALDISHLPGIPEAPALLSGDILLLEQPFSTDDSNVPQADAQQPAPQWITSISSHAPTTTFSDSLNPELSYSVPSLDEELAHALQGDSYELIEPFNNVLTLNFLENHLTLADTQYLLNYLVVYLPTGEVISNQIYIIEIDENGQIFALSNVDFYWNTVSQLQDIDDFIQEVFVDSIDAGDVVHLYQHIPNSGIQTPPPPLR